MSINDIIEELKLRANDAEAAMNLAEASGYKEYDYHEGRFEAYGAMVGLLESRFFKGGPE